MPATFEPRLDILPASQRRLWPELDAVPSQFVLYGGTGLALQLGLRASEDFDFFSSLGFDSNHLHQRLPFFRDLDPEDRDLWVHRERDNLEAFVDREGAVKVAFFGGLDTLQRVEDPRRAAGSRVQVASLVDLAGMKMIHALVSNGIDVSTGLAAAKDEHSRPAVLWRWAMRSDLTHWAQAIDLSKLPAMRPRRGLAPGGMER